MIIGKYNGSVTPKSRVVKKWAGKECNADLICHSHWYFAHSRNLLLSQESRKRNVPNKRTCIPNFFGQMKNYHFQFPLFNIWKIWWDYFENCWKYLNIAENYWVSVGYCTCMFIRYSKAKIRKGPKLCLLCQFLDFLLCRFSSCICFGTEVGNTSMHLSPSTFPQWFETTKKSHF